MTKVQIQRLPTDSFCPRVSIGGNRALGFYCLYRGTREEAILATQNILIVLENMPEQPIEPEPLEINKEN